MVLFTCYSHFKQILTLFFSSNVSSSNCSLILFAWIFSSTSSLDIWKALDRDKKKPLVLYWTDKLRLIHAWHSSWTVPSVCPPHSGPACRTGLCWSWPGGPVCLPGSPLWRKGAHFCLAAATKSDMSRNFSLQWGDKGTLAPWIMSHVLFCPYQE